MTERLSPERRAEIERRVENGTASRYLTHPLLAELRAVEQENRTLREKLANAFTKQVCFIHRKNPDDPTYCNGFHSCSSARYALEELARGGGGVDAAV